MAIDNLTADSVPSFLKAVSSLIKQWSSRGKGRVDPWFRGHEDAVYELRPRVYRYKIADEDELRAEFRRRSSPMLLETRPSDDREWCFLMQHYGVPTRLLDWSDGALLGFYFAVRSSNSDRNAAVWILAPWWLNKSVIGKSDVMQTWEAAVRQYLPKVFDKEGKGRVPHLPLAIEPAHPWRRVSAQRSCFTTHGTEPDGPHGSC